MKKVYIEPEASVVKMGTFLQGGEVIIEGSERDDFTNKDNTFDSEEDGDTGSPIWDTSTGE